MINRKRPHLTCLRSTTLDGRIDIDRMGRDAPGKLEGDAAVRIPNDGWIVGRVTMGEIIKGRLYVDAARLFNSGISVSHLAPALADTLPSSR